MNKRLGALGMAIAAVAAAAGLFADPSNSAANHSTGSYCPTVPVCLVAVTATGPSPSMVKLPAGGAYHYVLFHNTDSVTHTVVFTNGLCSLTLAAGEYGELPNIAGPPCNAAFPFYVGSYAYMVDGQFPGTVVTVPAPRSVTLAARTHTIRGGTRLTLHGLVNPPGWRYHVSDPPGWKHVVTVTVLARHNSQEPFRPVATVNPRILAAVPGRWKLTVQPRVPTTYIAKATGQPPEGRIWANAKSRPFIVRIRSSR